MKKLVVAVLLVAAFYKFNYPTYIANVEDGRSPCASREPSLSTCSEFGAACVAYFNSPAAPTDTLRSKMTGMDAKSCMEWKNQCLNGGIWRGPNCIIINIQRR
jgi:hypothetical protein